MFGLKNTPNEASEEVKFAPHLLGRYAIPAHSQRRFETFSRLKSLELVLNALNAPLRNEFENIQHLRKHGITALLDYLKRAHRQYINKRIPEIEQTVEVLFASENPPSHLLKWLKAYFQQYRAELTDHIKQEEDLLFPYAKFKDAESRGLQPDKLSAEVMFYSAEQFLAEHSDTELNISLIKEVIGEYAPNKVVMSPYRVLMHQLQAFEQDLQVHELIEENVLVAELLRLE